MAGTSKANLMQTAINNATALVSALVSVGAVQKDDIMATLNGYRDEFFKALEAQPTDAPQSRGGGQRRSSGGGGSNDPGTVVLNYGAFKGQTIQDVFAMDVEKAKEFGYDKPGREYVTWLSKNRNNKFLQDRATAFIEKQRASSGTEEPVDFE